MWELGSISRIDGPVPLPPLNGFTWEMDGSLLVAICRVINRSIVFMFHSIIFTSVALFLLVVPKRLAFDPSVSC